MALFQKSVLNKHLKGLDLAKVGAAYQKFSAHFHNPAIQLNIRKSKEEQYQGEFLIDLFVNVLGYTKSPEPNFNLTTEFKNIKNAKKADGAILEKGKAIAVIELKGMDTPNLDKVEGQAFGYKSNQPDAVYVITSNFEKLRFYIDNAVDFIEWNLFNLTREQFNEVWLCLAKESVLSGLPKQIKEDSIIEEKTITERLYKDYSTFRGELYNSMSKHNPDIDPLLLFKKTQKLLDRFLFIFFAEDRLLVPPNSISRIIDRWRQLAELDHAKPLYEIFQQYFGYFNSGRKGKKPVDDIFAYNGGLFKPDATLDSLKVDDFVLLKHTSKLTKYDFVSEVDVNILGHIFEHSLNDIEEINAQLEGETLDKSKSKRKKDGVFYTPKYITKYIVENTVGKLCEEKKTDLGIIDIDFSKTYMTKRKRTTKDGKKTFLSVEGENIYNSLNQYRDYLLNLTICDPACGSGAFLNQAFNFLIDEHENIDQYHASLRGDTMTLTDVTKDILEFNLFGVDINQEAVEIAKLSLWLRTAQKGRKLNNLNENIKCGNSLIDDPEVAGEKAFSWEKEFPEVFKNGGFDVVIGNPPYVPTEFIGDNDKVFLEKNYQSAFGRINLYPVFYEKGIKVLNNRGKLGYITPYTLLKNQYYIECRKFILEKTSLNTLIDFKGITVFEDAAVDSIILILTKTISPNNTFEQIFNIKDFKSNEFQRLNIAQSEISKSEDFGLFVSINDKLIDKIKRSTIPLKDVVNFNQGIITGGNKNFLTNVSSEKTKKVLTGSDFNRYIIKEVDNHILYDVEKLHRPRKKEIFEVGEKILLRQTSSYPICAIDNKSHYTLDTIHNGLIIDKNFDAKFLLTLLNSKLLRFIYENQINETGKVFAQVKIIYINPLPVKPISTQGQLKFTLKVDLMTKNSKDLFKNISSFTRLIERKFNIEKLSKKLQNWHTLIFADFVKELKKKKIKLGLAEESEWEQYFETEKVKALAIKAVIDKTDKEIDQMVYSLYGLNEEEIAIVENS